MPTAARRGILLLWVVLSLGWLASDSLVRDGDEEGHVGAAELFMEDLANGDVAGFAQRLWSGPMGEYPQGFSAMVGSWWWVQDGGLPGRPAVRAICLLSMLLAAWATGRIARRMVIPARADVAELVALGTVLCIPLINGLSRHFMPEGLMVAMVALAVLAAIRLVEQPCAARAVGLGVALGLGLLVKQTFALLVLLPLLLQLRRLGRAVLPWGGLAAVITALIAGPWWIANAAQQWSYGTASLGSDGTGGVLQHVAYYPLTSLWLGLGPVLGLVAILSVASLVRSPSRAALHLGAAWLLGGLLLLTLVPKKYPRLMAPLLPGAALWIGVAIAGSRKPKRWAGIGGCGAAAWLSLSSTLFLPAHPDTPSIDPGCPQIWLRPPVGDDLGLARVAALIDAQGAGAVRIIDSPVIPCEVQTTHDWHQHLAPYLRRMGSDRQVLTTGSAPIVVDWSGGPGEAVDIEALGATVWIRRDTVKP